jgi:hypothetical protein
VGRLAGYGRDNARRMSYGWQAEMLASAVEGVVEVPKEILLSDLRQDI